jgi:RHS repeat-associated protein
VGHAFTGREWDPETGLYYYRARYYDSRIGRFISEDPIGFAGGANFYAYVENGPTNRVDPTGLEVLNPPGWENAGPAFAPPPWMANFSAGVGDALLLGQGSRMRAAMDMGGTIDECSTAYRAGGWVAVVGSLARAVYIGAAAGLAAAATSGAEASAGRTALAAAFRGGFGKGWRTPPSGKYATDAALRAGAGRTNTWVNAYAAIVGGTGAAEGSGCGCQR